MSMRRYKVVTSLTWNNGKGERHSASAGDEVKLDETTGGIAEAVAAGRMVLIEQEKPVGRKKASAPVVEDDIGLDAE